MVETLEKQEISQFEQDLYDKLTWMEENPDKLVWHSIEDVEKRLGIA